MPSRIAPGPSVRPESIRAWIRLDPSVIEPGLRLLDFEVRTGPDTSLDAVGLDRSGRLVILTVASGDPDAALARLLDGHLWVKDQGDLLSRLYSDRGLSGDRGARGFLLAPYFTHAFLHRLSLLSIEIVPCLAREVDAGDGPPRTIVEPAAPLFGLEPRVASETADVKREDRQPFWPDGVLPSEPPPVRGSIAVMAENDARSASRVQDEVRDDDAAMPWSETPDDLLPWEIDGARPEGAVIEADAYAEAEPRLPPPADGPPSGEPASTGAFEPLTIDELDEFDRFERQRRERGRRSS